MSIDIYYHLTIMTADEPNAGTDATVYFRLYGDKGETSDIVLEDERRTFKKFERGRADKFVVETADVGKVIIICQNCQPLHRPLSSLFPQFLSLSFSLLHFVNPSPLLNTAPFSFHPENRILYLRHSTGSPITELATRPPSAHLT